jgi:hypothetical protein
VGVRRAGKHVAVKTPKERQDEKRKAKLKEMQEQIDSGDLVVRKMTAAERKKFPPKPPREKKKKR